jgi:hypothetical protein
MSKENQLSEKQLLPILQFTQRLAEIIRDHKRDFKFEVKYDSTNYYVTYSFDIALELGRYKADLTMCYDEVKAEEENDYDDLINQLNHIEKVIKI